jgi:hypothetical protein
MGNSIWPPVLLLSFLGVAVLFAMGKFTSTNKFTIENISKWFTPVPTDPIEGYFDYRYSLVGLQVTPAIRFGVGLGYLHAMQYNSDSTYTLAASIPWPQIKQLSVSQAQLLLQIESAKMSVSILGENFEPILAKLVTQS